jgi:hypothetical protein
MRLTPRRVLGVFGVAASALVALAVAAYACTNMATLNLSSARGKPGDTITVTGSSFGVVCVCGPSQPPTQVKIRWNGIKGDVMAEAMPDKAGTLSVAFTVPETRPGYYVVVATQRDEVYHIDYAGTPSRATFEVLAANGQSIVGDSEVEALGPADPQTSSGLIGLTIGLGVLGLALFAGGSIAVIRQVASRKSRVAARVPSS